MAIPARKNTSAEVLSQMTEFGFNGGSDTKLGDLDDGGLTISITTQEIQTTSGSQKEIYAYGTGATDQAFSGSLLNINVNNMAFALGMTENATNITGAGSSGDPYLLTADPATYGQQVNRLYYGNGTRVDGDFIRFEASTARVYAPDIEFVMNQGQAAVIPFTLRVTGTWLLKQWT